MISPASFNYYLEMLEDASNTTGCLGFSDKTLEIALDCLITYSNTENEQA